MLTSDEKSFLNVLLRASIATVVLSTSVGIADRSLKAAELADQTPLCFCAIRANDIPIGVYVCSCESGALVGSGDARGGGATHSATAGDSSRDPSITGQVDNYEAIELSAWPLAQTENANLRLTEPSPSPNKPPPRPSPDRDRQPIELLRAQVDLLSEAIAETADHDVSEAWNSLKRVADKPTSDKPDVQFDEITILRSSGASSSSTNEIEGVPPRGSPDGRIVAELKDIIRSGKTDASMMEEIKRLIGSMASGPRSQPSPD